ncbi:Uncharacterised protein [uncultured archaeon]|nr:Uncharacterised protein [uncultured archaeon]
MIFIHNFKIIITLIIRKASEEKLQFSFCSQSSLLYTSMNFIPAITRTTASRL